MASATSRRAGRRDGPSKGDRREHALVAAAERLLAAGRFRDASVADLAREANISRASFYFYFASKQALLAAVIDEAVRQFNARILRELDTDDDRPPAELVAATILAARDLWWEHADVLCASVELGAAMPEVYDRTMANVAVVRRPTTALLQRHGRVPEADDAEEAERLVTALILMTERNFYDLMRGDPTTTARDALTARLMRIWQRAFGLDTGH